MNLEEIDWRFAALLLWGAGTVLAYGLVLRGRFHAWIRHKDVRSRRELIYGIGLFLTSLASATSLTVVLFGEAGTSVRGWFVAVSLGAFTGTGIIMASEDHDD